MKPVKVAMIGVGAISGIYLENITNTFRAVSYTHLDVYKRQKQCESHVCERGTELAESRVPPDTWNPVGIWAVSYTHLDVYKRQLGY